MKKRKKLPQIVSRRQFVSMMGLGSLYCSRFSPVQMVLTSLVDGLISNAQAGGAGSGPMNYVSILMPGAPPRWIWDGYLNPNGESITANLSVGNYLASDTYTGGSSGQSYQAQFVPLAGGPATQNGQAGIWLPPLWNQNIPASSNGSPAMSTLLNNALIIRGVDMQVDLGHVLGPGKVPFPLGAAASLTGLAADAAATPIPMVGYSGGYADPAMQGYQSVKGVAPALISPSAPNPLGFVLNPFINQDPTVLSNLQNNRKSAAIQSAIQGALAQLGTFASSSLPGSDALYKNASNAMQLIHSGIGGLSNAYTTLHAKYSSYYQACGAPIPNLIPTTSQNAAYTPGSNMNFANGQWLDPTTLPAQFAVAEYLLTNGYSSVISISDPYGTTINLNGLSAFNDEHSQNDRQMSIICHSYQFLALATMINELKNALIAKGLWNQTVIHVSAEFNRMPQNTGTGSDHSPASNVMSLFSGAITQPIFIGNTQSGGPSTGPQKTLYSGDFGLGAPVLTSSGNASNAAGSSSSIMISNAMCASTVAALLGIQNPFTQSSSLVSVNPSGGITSLCENTKSIS